MAYGSSTGDVPLYTTSSEGGLERGERGYRRRKLAALAESLYRTGQQAVSEIRETYAHSRARDLDGGLDEQGSVYIPEAFPDVAIAAQGGEQMVLFPCYTKRHVRRPWGPTHAQQSQTACGGSQHEEYWRQQWESNQDEKAVVDVDVRGWIYSPQTGPITRRNRFLIGLARQLSGIPAPRTDQPHGSPSLPMDDYDERKIAHEAAKIEQSGQEKRRVASRGAYSEQTQETFAFGDSTLRPPRGIGGGSSQDLASESPRLKPRQTLAANTELTDAELAVANTNLMARIAAFMTNPLVALPITIFFYNHKKSQSRTVMTNDAGHFDVRAALDFVPTSIRVLANERLSATQEIKVTSPYGVSLISDIDDTVKTSNISAGAREIFRNTFVRELSDLTVDGVKEWYSAMHALGVSMHYCSNSPWQLFPMLLTFFKSAGLPPGSFHLKQYSGMLQGIFEPVAERKKNTLAQLLHDFPSRKFLLVGDSGEVDLEVYTELAVANPGSVLGIFIRDVTTAEGTPYFDHSFDLARQGVSGMTLSDGSGKVNGVANNYPHRHNSAPGSVGEAKQSLGLTLGTLIDLSEEPEDANLNRAAAMEQVKGSRPGPTVSAIDLLSRKPPPPPRPFKPAALSGAPAAATGVNKGPVGLGLYRASTSPNADVQPSTSSVRKPVATARGSQANTSFTQLPNLSQHALGTASQQANNAADRATPPPPPPPPRRRATPLSSVRSLSPQMFAQSRGHSANSDVDFEPLPPSLAPTPAGGMTYYRSNSRSGNSSPSGSPTFGPANKKRELWRRRLVRAQEQLDPLGVPLYTWRKGQDVEAEALALIKQALKEMDQKRR